MRQYCAVTGYVAPQNKFELRLPLPADWNHDYFFAACGGFCGTVNGALCAPALERRYASVTTNSGHDSAAGFDGASAAGAPNLPEGFAWRGTHLVTLATKAIVTRLYGESIQRSYMSGCSKGGQAVLMEAQRLPENYDGLMPVAPVYDYTGRSVVAAAWFAQVGRRALCFRSGRAAGSRSGPEDEPAGAIVSSFRGTPVVSAGTRWVPTVHPKYAFWNVLSS